MSIPNYLTLFRILLTPVFFITLVSYTPEKEGIRLIALAIFVVAALTDALDGLLARYLKQRTALGQMLDPLADKILLVSAYIGLLFVSTLPFRPPLWITITIIFRDLILLFGFLTLNFAAVKIEVQPNIWGKLTTVSQMLLLCFILLEWPVAIPLAFLTVAFTIASGIIYITRGLKFIQ
ncbi:MAG: CDP-diacylglycerol--glycerol-3-phosphate 3-phosphatidyltransferase [Candidatus Omnitrophota bacterium]